MAKAAGTGVGVAVDVREAVDSALSNLRVSTLTQIAIGKRVETARRSVLLGGLKDNEKSPRCRLGLAVQPLIVNQSNYF